MSWILNVGDKSLQGAVSEEAMSVEPLGPALVLGSCGDACWLLCLIHFAVPLAQWLSKEHRCCRSQAPNTSQSMHHFLLAPYFLHLIFLSVTKGLAQSWRFSLIPRPCTLLLQDLVTLFLSDSQTSGGLGLAAFPIQFIISKLALSRAF